MALPTSLADRASMVQRDMDNNVKLFRPQRARTLSTFKQGTRKKNARLAGIQIPFWTTLSHGQTWNNPHAGDTSYKKSIREKSGAMYAGVVFRNMNMYLEEHMQRDLKKGYIPDSYLEERARRIGTHMWKKNIGAIGDGRGILAIVDSSSSGLMTLAFDNTARMRSKGSFRLQVTDSEDPLYYDAVNLSSHAVVATFYISSKPSGVTAQAAGFTVGGNSDLNSAGLGIVESGSYNKEIIGIAGHISDSSSRVYQGASMADYPFLRNPSVDGGGVAVTPTAIHSAKGVLQTRANSASADEGYVCHLSFGNYRTLAKFGYGFYDQNANAGHKTTFGLPDEYRDGDTVFVPDADYEDAYIDLREKKPFFEYVHKEFGLVETGGVSRFQWQGANGAGSSNSYENYDEACNIVWDGRGMDGMNGNGQEGGSPNSSVFIKNLAIPTENQVNYGV